MAISLRAAGSWVASNANSQTVTLPTHQAGDLLIVRAACKPYSATITCSTSGWAAVAAQYANGTTANGNGVGSQAYRVFWKIAASSAETNPVVAWGTTSAPGVAVALSYQKAAGDLWITPAGAGGGDSTQRTSQTCTIGSHVSVEAGDLVDIFLGADDNHAITVPTVTQTGVTFGTASVQPSTPISTGTSNDMAASGAYRLATAGTSSAAAVCTATFADVAQGGAWQTRLRTVTPVSCTPDLVALTLTTFAPVVTTTMHWGDWSDTFDNPASDVVLVTPTTASLALATFVPVVAYEPVLATPPAAALALSTFVPTVTVRGWGEWSATFDNAASDAALAVPPTASLALTTYAPTVLPGAYPIVPSPAALVLATYAPTVLAYVGMHVFQGNVFQANVFQVGGTGASVSPTPAALSLATYAPTVVGGDPKTVVPDLAELVTATFAPTVLAGHAATPDPLALLTALYAPTVTRSDHVLVVPGLEAMTMVGHAPTVTANQWLEIPVVDLILEAFDPVVSTSGDQVSTPGVLNLVTVLYAPSVTGAGVNVGGRSPGGHAWGHHRPRGRVTQEVPR